MEKIMYKNLCYVFLLVSIYLFFNNHIFSVIGTVAQTHKNSSELMQSGIDKKICESFKRRFQRKVDCREHCIEKFTTYQEQRECMSYCEKCLTHLTY
jgi:hypothetical protein